MYDERRYDEGGSRSRRVCRVEETEVFVIKLACGLRCGDIM
jgi:hypothetical protein